jgi:hypothetical protein
MDNKIQKVSDYELFLFMNKYQDKKQSLQKKDIEFMEKLGIQILKVNPGYDMEDWKSITVFSEEDRSKLLNLKLIAEKDGFSFEKWKVERKIYEGLHKKLDDYLNNSIPPKPLLNKYYK